MEISLTDALPPALHSSFRHNVNNLAEESPVLKKQSSKELYLFITNQQLPSSAFQQIAAQFLKPILKSFGDKSEEVRENCVKIVIELIMRCEEVESMLPYVLAVLVERLGCGDLEGIKNMSEAMKPPPGQKPKTILKLTETSEQVRMTISKLVEKIIGMTELSTMRNHVDSMVNILRALAMDPSGDIQYAACGVLETFCGQYKNILLHYTEALGRAILLPLISKKSKIRVAALDALNSVLECGVWKYNAFVFEILIGFKDPNTVAIKEFYQPTFNINYLATLIVDPSPRVREKFMKCVHFWVCRLDDKYDHHPKLVPYVLSGLFDEEPVIREIALQTLEEIGQQIEKEKQNEFKESRQYGVDAVWTWEGRLISLPLVSPFKERPRLGSRFFVRGHIRGLWPALFREIRDINIQHRKKAVNLALMGVIYTQQFMSSHLDKFIPNFITSLRVTSPEEAYISNKVEQIFVYLGRYCPYSSYIHIIRSGIKGEIVQNQDFVQCTFKALGKLMQGSLEAIPEGAGLCHKRMEISDLLNTINELQLEQEINAKNSREVEELIRVLVEGINLKATPSEKAELYGAHFIDLLRLLAISIHEHHLGLFSISSVEVGPLMLEEDLKILLSTATKMLENHVGMVELELKETFNNLPSLGDPTFKFLTGLLTILSLSGEQPQLVESIGQVLMEILEYNQISELIDYLLKLVQSILLTEKQESLHTIVDITYGCMINLSRFRSHRKAPVYEQPTQPQPHHILILEDKVTTIFKHLTDVLHTLQSRNLVQKEEYLGQLVFGYITAANSFRRMKELTVNSVKPLWALLERTQCNIGVQKFRHQEGYVMPLLVDYLVERIETIEAGTSMYNLAIGALAKLSNLFPDASKDNKDQDMQMFHPHWQRLFDKLLKHCLNERDVQSKQKLRNILHSLRNKMPKWFEIKGREAMSHGMHERAKLIGELGE